MAYEAKKPPEVYYVVVVQIQEVTLPTRMVNGVLTPASMTEKRVEDLVGISVRGTSVESAIDRARSYLDTEQDNLTAEKSDA